MLWLVTQVWTDQQKKELHIDTKCVTKNTLQQKLNATQIDKMCREIYKYKDQWYDQIKKCKPKTSADFVTTFLSLVDARNMIQSLEGPSKEKKTPKKTPKKDKEPVEISEDKKIPNKMLKKDKEPVDNPQKKHTRRKSLKMNKEPQDILDTKSEDTPDDHENKISEDNDKNSEDDESTDEVSQTLGSETVSHKDNDDHTSPPTKKRKTPQVNGTRVDMYPMLEYQFKNAVTGAVYRSSELIDLITKGVYIIDVETKEKNHTHPINFSRVMKYAQERHEMLQKYNNPI